MFFAVQAAVFNECSVLQTETRHFAKKIIDTKLSSCEAGATGDVGIFIFVMPLSVFYTWRSPVSVIIDNNIESQQEVLWHMSSPAGPDISHNTT